MKIGLFIPCYVDALYPEVGVSTFKLLRSLGLDVDYPEKQTCCGQPMGNAGYERMAEPLAEKFDTLFSGYDYVVAPSASCAAYVRFFHPNMMEKAGHTCQAAGKTMDLVELGLSSPSERNVPRFNKIIDLLRLVEGIEVMEPERPDECCGFGGMFAVEETAVSARMGLDKLRRHMATGAEYITGPDSSCLMHMQGVARKQGLDIKFIHVAQILSSGL